MNSIIYYILIFDIFIDFESDLQIHQINLSKKWIYSRVDSERGIQF